MTREEAVAELNTFKIGAKSELGENALDMAIKALEQEPCEDCVSRNAIEKLKRYRFSYNNDTTIPKSDLFVKLTDLRDLRSVAPIRKKGKWIGHGEHCENLGVIPNGLGAYEWCSNCDCGIDVREWHRNHYKYCPNCGADMRGEE